MLKTFLLAYTTFNLARCEPVQMRATTLLSYQMIVNTDLTKTRRAEFVKVVAGSSFTLDDFNLFLVKNKSASSDDNDDDGESSSSSSCDSPVEESQKLEM